MRIVSKELGGTDDAAFLKAVWNMSIEEIDDLLNDAATDLNWFKTFQMGKEKIMGSFNRRTLMIAKSRIPWIKQIKASKQENPDFIPDRYKQ